MTVLIRYTTREYIQDCVKLARAATHLGLKHRHTARTATSEGIRRFRAHSADWQRTFAQGCMANAREAKQDYISRRGVSP